MSAIRNEQHTRGELLAPVGGWPQLQSALRFGADAIYMAAHRFGMRARADNFSLEEIGEVVRRAHAHGVRVYITLNIVMDDGDIAKLPEYLESLAACGVDAFIVSDLGAFRLAKRYAPHVALHVSTQASVSNVQAALMWYELGAKRIVCARELSLEQIAYMRAHLPRELELEAFVHGAMCMAVSGRCLLSAALAHRSANKGNCAQSCRWNYALMEQTRPGEYLPIEEDAKGSYIMNAQDMNMLAHLRALSEAGIDSFKIEGRNKKALYVAAVTRAYRHVLDGGDIALFEPELNSISHRPYSSGFYFGEPTQSFEADGYEKECLHVATVIASECLTDGNYRTFAFCHNRFCEGDCLEALTPAQFIRSVRVQRLAHVYREHEDFSGSEAYKLMGVSGFNPARGGKICPVSVANRAMNVYCFESCQALEVGDILRVRLESDGGLC